MGTEPISGGNALMNHIRCSGVLTTLTRCKAERNVSTKKKETGQQQQVSLLAERCVFILPLTNLERLPFC